MIGKALFTSFEYRNSSPLSLFPYSTAVADSEEPGYSVNPSYLPLYRYSYAASSVSNPYSFSGLYSGNLTLGTSYKNAGFQAAWNRLGTDFYSENSVDAGTGFRPFSFISLGAGVSVDRLVFGYAYDFGLNSLQKHSYGTHEFTFIAKLGDVTSRHRWLSRY